MFELTGKTALVTGATGGIGGAIARALHKQGATIAISGRQQAKLEKLAAGLGSNAHVLPCDLAERRRWRWSTSRRKLGRLDILINNAVLPRTPFR